MTPWFQGLPYGVEGPSGLHLMILGDYTVLGIELESATYKLSVLSLSGPKKFLMRYIYLFMCV